MKYKKRSYYWRDTGKKNAYQYRVSIILKKLSLRNEKLLIQNKNLYNKFTALQIY